MTQCTADFELGTNGNNILPADSGSATAWDSVTAISGATARYSNVQPAHGSLGALFNSGGGNHQTYCTWSTALGTLSGTHYGRFYLYLPALDTQTLWLMRILNTAAEVMHLAILSSGKLYIQTNGGNAQTTTNVSLNQLVRIEYKVVQSGSAGSVEAKLFNTASSTTPDETITTATNLNTQTQATSFDIGLGVGVLDPATVSFLAYIDDIVVGATSYPGPAGGGGGGAALAIGDVGIRDQGMGDVTASDRGMGGVVILDRSMGDVLITP